jgi:hypothetical protein
VRAIVATVAIARSEGSSCHAGNGGGDATFNPRTEVEFVPRRSSKRTGKAKAGKPPKLRGCGGTSLLVLISLYFAYLFFFVGRTWLGKGVGAAVIVFIGVLTWYYYKSARQPR